MRHPLHHRLIALLLSWAVPATSMWAAPPPASPAGVRSPAVPDDESARRQSQKLQALASFEILARGRRAPYGVAAVGSRVFFTDEKEGALYEIVSPGVAVARLSRLRKPRGAIADGQAVLLVAEALDPVNAKGRDQEDRARGALPRGLVLRYDIASRGVVTVASGLKHPRSLAKGPDGTLYVTSEGLLGANERHEDSDCDAADGGDDDDDRGPGHPGTVLRWTQATGFVTVAGGFKRPAGLVVAADGTALVAAERYRVGAFRLFGSAFRVTAAGEVTVHLADRLRRPTGLVRDGAAHLFLSGERRERRGSHPGLILKKGREEQPSSGFASGLLAPKGLALTSAGDLVAADSMAGVVVRFRAPAPPTLRLPAPGATPRDPFDLQGAAEAGAQVLVRGGREAASALAGAAGSFSVSVPLHRNQPNTLEALAIARGGDGLASAPTAGVLIHDDIAPLIAAAGDPPANAAGWNRTDVTVRFTCSDGGSGVLSCPPPRSVPSEGAGQEVFGTAFDQAGNSASTRLVLNIDKTPPAVLISDPTDGHYTNATAIAVSGRVVDATDVVLTVNGVGVEVAPPDAAGARGFSAGVPLGEAATVVLRAAAEDVAGNAGEASVTVNVDRAAPTLRVASPAVGAYLPTRAPEIELEYQDDRMLDTGSLQVLINGEDRTALFARDAAAATARLEGVLELPEGRTLIAARIRDRAGNSASAEAAFVVDTEAPVVGIAAPAEESYHRASPVSLSGSVQDRDPELLVDCVAGGSTVAATVSPQAAASGQMLSANFSCAVALTEGANAVAVVARDRFIGRETRLTRTLHLDTLAPQVAIEEPMGGTVTAAHSLSVRVRMSDASPVTVLVGGQPASCDDQGSGACAGGGSALFVAGGVPLGAGPSATLTAVATDAAGNATTESVTIGIDRAAPSVAITAPVAGAYVKGGVIEIAGTAADETPIVVDVHGLPAEVRRIGTDGSGRTTYSFTAQVPAADGALSVTATALDAAGNQGTATVELKVDSAPPQITISEPAEGFVTKAEALTISGSIVDSSPASVVIDGQPVPCPGPVGTPFTCTFTASIALSSEGSASFDIRGRDAAGNESARTVAVTVDRTEPILEIASPSAGAAVGSLPVAVQGTVSDRTEVSVTVDGQPATRTEQAWLASFGALPEGPHTFTVVAIDAAGNQTTRTVDAVVDLGPPAVSIDAPPPGFLTRESSVPATATVNDRSAITATLGGVPMTCTPLGSGSHACTGTAPLNEGDNTLLVSATDATGRTTEQSLTVTRDSIAPALELLTPDTISRGRPGTATATASDALGVERVVLSVACVAPASCAPQSQAFTAPPYLLALAVPEGVDPGQTLAVTAEAFDRAGNVAQATRSVRVIGDGAVVGQALNDATGLPLVGASVRLLGPGQAVTRETTTDERGRYSLPTTDLAAVVRIEKDGLTSVERQVDVASGAGTVPVDARLTVLADEQVSDGTAAVVAGAFSLSLAAGSYRFTPLSPQGLPGLLPLGFSPLAAIHARGPVSGASGSVNGLASGTFHLVRYDFTSHAWRMVAPNLQPSAGALTLTLPDQGAYAVVAADTLDPEVAIPPVDEPLEGIAMVALPVTAVSTGQVEPSVIPPTGGTAVGRIAVTSPVALPSGTVVRADITETYTLATGEVASEERRLMDVVLFGREDVNVTRDPASGASSFTCPTNALCASFPIRPSRTYSTGELLAGKVHLDILGGREGVRGTVGGSESVTLEAGAARLFVPQGALSEDTAFVLEEHALSSFLPSTTALVPLAEVVADLSGQTLRVPAELQVASPGVGAGDTLVFAKVERVDGIPRYAVVALGQLVGDRIVSRPYPGLSGVVKGGRYVLYRLGAPIGFIAGTLSSSAGPVKSLVEPAPGDPGSLPFIAFSGIGGSYILASATGQRSVQARVVGTALAASASVGVSADAITVQNLLLAGAVTTATLNPPDGALGVNTTTAIEISSSSALNPATVVPANVSLIKLGATPAENTSVALRLVLASSGKLVSVIPQPALEYSKMYRLEASGLVDQVGGVVVVPTTTFRTKDFVAPFYDPKKLVFSMPNQDGIVTVRAPGCHPEPGCFYPGTTILIINSGNGVVLSLVAGNDGEINSELPASINDTMFVTINDPLGNSVSFQKSEFVDQTTGETGVGPGGGTVRSLDGATELRIPEGALENGLTFKVSVVPESELENLFPNNEHERILEGGHLGPMVRIEPSQDTRFRKEVDLAFPLPDFTKVAEQERPANPKDAFYFIHRRVERCPDGTTTCPEDQRIVVFEAIDDARVEGEGADARVVTASFPFSGITVAWATLGITLMVLGWWLKDAQTQLPPIAAVSGKVLRAKFNETTKTLEYVPVEGAQVSGFDLSGERLINKAGGSYATSQKDGTFALTDAHYSGGQISIYAMLGEEVAQATAFEVTGGFAAKFRKGATANITFPEQAEPPPPPLLQVHVRRKSDGKDVGGYAVAGVPLKISFTSNYDVIGVQVEGQQYSAKVSDTDLLTWEVLEDYLPAEVGTVEIVATARSSDTGALVTVTRSLRVLAQGGAVDNVPTKPPRVTAIEPNADEVGVPVSAFLQVFFSEPVKNVKDAATSVENVTLAEIDETNAAGPPLPIRISGVRPTGEAVPSITSSSETVTSLSIEPLLGLKYGQRYRVSLKSGIQDLDKDVQQNPAPKSLVPFSWSFEIFGPESVGGSAEATGSPGIAVIGSRAYLTRTNNFANGTLEGYRIDDPVLPAKLREEEQFAPRPYDIVGSGHDGDRLVAIATGSTSQSKPASVLLYDVTNDEDFRWIGAATVASNAYEGFITRLAIFNGAVYTATVRRGIQVVDISQAKAQMDALLQRSDARFKLQQARADLNSDGIGFGHEAVVQTLPLPQKPNNTDYYLNDLKVADLSGQTVVVVVGEPGLVVAAPAFGTINYSGRPEKTETLPGGGKRVVKLEWGLALALAPLDDRDIAVVVGLGKIDGVSQALLLAVDLANLANPSLVGYLDLGPYLSGLQPVDVLVKDNTALIGLQNGARDQGAVLLVSLADVTKPAFAGRLVGQDGKPLGGRLALTDTGLLLSTAKASLGGATPLGGIRTAAFDTVGAVLPVNPVLAKFVPNTDLVREETLKDIPLQMRTYPKSQKVPEVVLELFEGTVPVQPPLAFTLTNDAASYTVPEGLTKEVKKDITAKISFTFKGRLVSSAPRLLPISAIRLTLDSNNDTIVEDKDDEDVLSDPNKNDPATAKRFVFWEGDTRIDPEPSSLDLGGPGPVGPPDFAAILSDYAVLRLQLRAPVAEDEKIGVLLSNSAWEMFEKSNAEPGAQSGCGSEADSRDWKGKEHLCHRETVVAQGRLLSPDNPRPKPEAATPQGLVEIPNELLRKGDNLFLFRCKGRGANEPTCPALSMEVVRITTAGTEKIDERRIDVKPFRQLTGMVSLRKNSTFNEDPANDHFKVNPTHREEWAPIPANAKQITLMVHGFNVTDQEFKDGTPKIGCQGPDYLLCVATGGFNPSWFGAWAKKLYWAGQPVLAVQDASIIGVAWPGDMLGVTLPPLPRTLLYFPEDEFAALQSGLPLGRFIRELRERPGLERLNILAHSLGNMVVNNALKEVPPTTGNATINYVMNDAAISSDAFEQNWDPVKERDAGVKGLGELIQHAQRLGFPDPDNGRPKADHEWLAQEQRIRDLRLAPPTGYSCPTDGSAPPLLPANCNDEPTPAECLPTRCEPVNLYHGRQVNTKLTENLPVDPEDPQAQPFFTRRWRAHLNSDGSVGGPWTRFFARSNSAPGINIFNTYNERDSVLRIDNGIRPLPQVQGTFRLHAWRIAQVEYKPYGGINRAEVMAKLSRAFLGTWLERAETDSLTEQKWWTLQAPSRPSAWRSTAETAAEQRTIWPDGLAPRDTVPTNEEERLEAITRRTRDWAELAVWYPALAPAAGAVPVRSLSSVSVPADTPLTDLIRAQGRNVDFTSIGGELGVDFLNTGSNISHSYMAVKPLHEVWRGYRVIRSLFTVPSNP